MALEGWNSPAGIEAWWAGPTQSGIGLKRPYTAETVAKLREPFPESLPSNQMSLKVKGLFNTLLETKGVSLAAAPLDGVSQHMLSEAGLETVYVSGAVTSMNASDDPSTDQSDYSYDTVPKKVGSLHRAQMLYYRAAVAAGDPNPDRCLMPIIADADSGHGQSTAIMKLTKLFVQNGAAGFHIDDLLAGVKRYDGKDGEGYTIVPFGEYIRRLAASRLQLDIMGSECCLVCRTDGNTATRITSTVDPRDRPFILGATVEQGQDYYHLSVPAEQAAWKKAAAFATLDEAFKADQPDLYDQFEKSTAGLNVSEALRVAQKLAPPFYWSTEAARTLAGTYPFRGCIEASIGRGLAASDLSDVVWSNVFGYSQSDTEKFAAAIHAVNPKKWLGYNHTWAFPEDGSQDDLARELPQRLADLGYVWQFLPLSGWTAAGLSARDIAYTLREKGMLGYFETISRPAAKVPVLGASIEWLYKPMSKLTDGAFDAIGSGMQSAE